MGKATDRLAVLIATCSRLRCGERQVFRFNFGRRLNRGSNITFDNPIGVWRRGMSIAWST